ncbi:MAG: glycosyltransferase family 4 protein [Burkholderiales bacterium]|nr:glycosyltransferase family 4 protein [Burkholderiales bacterium]
MKLCLSNHGLRHSGGIERYAVTLVRGLHALGVRPTVIAKAFDTNLPEYAWVDALPVRMIGVPSKLRDLYFDWRIRRFKQRRDLGPLIACNQTGAADIAICGSTHPGYLAAMGERERRSDGWKIALERAHLTNAQFIVAHSQRMADEVQRFYGIDAGKIRLMYPPVDGERFSPVPDAERARLRTELKLPDDKAVFLLASTGHRRKGLDLLAAFFAKTELPVCLVVAGRPIDIDAPHIRYLGYRNDLHNVFRAVDFTVLASIFEPFGLVGVESVLCGTPIVAADNVGCVEVIRAPGQFTFSLARPESLGDAVGQGVAAWRAKTHRIADPLAALGYDPSVDVHVKALLALAEQVRAR